MALIREYDDGRLKKDAAAMDRILADDFTSVTPDGSLNTKAQFIATFTSTSSKLQAVDRDEVNVRFYGDTALVTSRAVLKMQWPDGRVASTAQRVMAVLVKQQGRWRFVGSQGTPVRQQAQTSGSPVK